jgi:hypothetical protein
MRRFSRQVPNWLPNLPNLPNLRAKVRKVGKVGKVGRADCDNGFDRGGEHGCGD